MSLDVASAYDGIAPEWDDMYKDNRSRAENLAVFELIRKGRFATGRVLDLACGTGMMLDYVDIAPTDYVGVDISKAMVQVASERHPEHTFLEGDMSRLGDFLEGPFDCIVCTFCGVSHVSQPLAFLEQCYRLLRPGGRIFLMPFGDKCAQDSAYHIHDQDGWQLDRLIWQKRGAYRWMDASGFRDLKVRGMTSWSAGWTELLPLWAARWLQWLDNVTTGRKRPDACYFLIVTGRKPDRQQESNA